LPVVGSTDPHQEFPIMESVRCSPKVPSRVRCATRLARLAGPGVLPGAHAVFPGLLLAFTLAPAHAMWSPLPNDRRNVDTGIRSSQCYGSGANALVACATADLPGQDGQLGRDTYPDTRDGRDGRLGFSFSRVCNNGDVAGSGACPDKPMLGECPGDWACILDNVTKMMWEVKPLTGFRARDLRYTNYSAEYDPLGEFGSPTDATGFIRQVNQIGPAGLCGFTDWKLSHAAKVQTIVDYGVTAAGSPVVDIRFYPNTNADWYWNASPNPASVENGWGVDFATGAVDNTADRAVLRYVQALRNGKDTFGPNGRYEILPDRSEVRDTSGNAHLIWQRCVEGMTWDGTTCAGTASSFTHEQALQRAALRATQTGQPWRVPSIKEQNWLVQRAIPSPPIEHDAFPGTPPFPSWTSSPDVRHPGNAWGIDFGPGLLAPYARTSRLNLRLARDSDQ
jgi:hypothetical protein